MWLRTNSSGPVPDLYLAAQFLHAVVLPIVKKTGASMCLPRNESQHDASSCGASNLCWPRYWLFLRYCCHCHPFWPQPLRCLRLYWVSPAAGRCCSNEMLDELLPGGSVYPWHQFRPYSPSRGCWRYLSPDTRTIFPKSLSHPCDKQSLETLQYFMGEPSAQRSWPHRWGNSP